MEKYYRPYNESEIKILRSRKYSYWDHFEHFGLRWVFVSLLLLAPFLLYEKFIQEVSPETELPIAIAIEIIAIAIVIYFMNKMGEIGWNKKVEKEIKNGKAEILKIKTDKVLKRRQTHDLGSGFYLKISDHETLYLQGQYYDELQYSRKFPNTEFELVKTTLTLNDLLDIQSFGKYLKPEKKLKAFTNEQYDKEKVHYDGDLLNIPIDEIK